MLYFSPLFLHRKLNGLSVSDRPTGPLSLMTSLFGLMTAISDISRPGATPNTSVVFVGVSITRSFG